MFRNREVFIQPDEQGFDLKLIKEEILKVEKHLDLNPDFSIGKVDFKVPSDKFNIMVLSEQMKEAVPRILGLKKNTRMLSIEELPKYPKHFVVWEQCENPERERVSEGQLEIDAEDSVFLSQRYLDFNLMKSQDEHVIQSCLKVMEAPS